jgi:hypothetical protein
MTAKTQTNQDQPTGNQTPTELKVDMSIIFQLGKKLYTQSPEIVFIRETVQNSLDARATNIEINANTEDDKLTLQVKDNGTGISNYSEYFLTLGGSTKRDTAGTIGGFGIAKLAIMAMDDWKIESLDGTITRQILIDHAPKDPESCEGCIVTGETKTYSRYYYDENIRTLLKLIKTEATIIYNGDRILPIETENYTTPNGNQIKRIIRNRGLNIINNVIIRLNGLPQFYRQIYIEGNIEDNYIYDIQTDESPYSENYPISANREATNQPHTSTISEIANEITKLSRDHAKLQKETRANIRLINESIALSGNATLKDLKTYAWHIKTYTRYIHQILSLLNETPEDYHYGLTIGGENPEVIGMYCRDHRSFFINPEKVTHGNKSQILEIATHEVTHIYEESHYDSYAYKYGEIAAKVLTGIFNKTFRQ